MQRPYLFPGTVASNVMFGPLQFGEQLAPEAVALLLEQVGLEDYGNRDVARLSGGEAQRVSLARALANRPGVLLLDEPTSALNEELKRRMEALIAKVSRENDLTCVLVTHDTAQAARLAGRIAVLEQGELVRIGTPDEVLHVERDS
ncbi:MAG: ATP-binding cassette domain-containing protein, partial [Acidobacteria bacterium]|nr:ATP-binding cassette domain-containing protein [Acidobacteriota bacterium]